jgi:putative ABC transport system substrate-binding protein
MRKKILFVISIAIFIAFFNYCNKNNLPIIAIANYGPHTSLETSIKGLKNQLADQGFIENKTIHYEIADVGFDPALIPQMITKLKNLHPKVMVVLTTPVAQFAKGKIHDIPLVYNAITDPIEAELIKDKNQSNGNMTGSSEKQDLQAFLSFVKTIFPDAKTVGLLYATAESNDAALIKMMRLAAFSAGMSILAIPIDQARDIPMRMQEFKDKADLIYVGTSGPIQPALPTIAQEAQKINIPIFNAEEQAVRDGLALASFGVSYESVGRNAGKLVGALLNGININTLKPLYPTLQDHHCFINKKQAEKLRIKIPKNAIVVE